MSRTFRHIPENNDGVRHPKRQNELRQLIGLHRDAIINHTKISPINRINRHVSDYFDNLVAASSHELYTTT